MTSTIKVSNLGFPRTGAHRELKRALERHWRGELNAEALLNTARDLRARNWQLQHEAGVDMLPANDFSLYDHVLDTAVLLNAIPDRYRALCKRDPLAGYFAMARGAQHGKTDLHALEMTKWFDTNYHYIVPELHAGQHFRLNGDKPIAEFLEAKELGYTTRPVLPGPVTFLWLSKTTDGSDRLALLHSLLPAYAELLAKLRKASAEWVQLDEPILVLELEESWKQALKEAYQALAQKSRPRLLVATYFGTLGNNLELAAELPADGLHVDLVRGSAQPGEELDALLRRLPPGRVVSAGVLDGRNVWRSDVDRGMVMARKLMSHQGTERVWLAPSCSLLHVPVDLDLEDEIDPLIKSWLSFAKQKLGELRTMADSLNGVPSARERVEESRAALKSRQTSRRVHSKAVQKRLLSVTPELTRRPQGYAMRAVRQQELLQLPVFPTTTIGSFPQTPEVREARARYKSGALAAADYEDFLRSEIARCVHKQEEIGLDVLVHGEFERNDMVEYFGEQLQGFVFTRHGWVQSYGSRCVKPPIIYGDVSRSAPMTVRWSAYAQSLSNRPVKGMLTGPVTMLQWSFVRDDQERAITCRQIALVLRDEVKDLEDAGIRVIQIDEPAMREGLPPKRSEWQHYLDWSVNAFRIASSGVRDETQIHTHMCYSEFNDIMDAVAALDADVISIETSRSRMELLDAFAKFRYPNGIGPGVYDIHSPRVPGRDEILELLGKARALLAPSQLWINPDCGLKTRSWPETEAALRTMVDAARSLRASEA